MQGLLNIQKSINVIHHINRLKKENHMIISIDTKKTFENTQHRFMTKTGKLEIEENYLNLIKNLYKKPTPHIIMVRN